MYWPMICSLLRILQLRRKHPKKRRLPVHPQLRTAVFTFSILRSGTARFWIFRTLLIMRGLTFRFTNQMARMLRSLLRKKTMTVHSLFMPTAQAMQWISRAVRKHRVPTSGNTTEIIRMHRNGLSFPMRMELLLLCQLSGRFLMFKTAAALTEPMSRLIRATERLPRSSVP